MQGLSIHETMSGSYDIFLSYSEAQQDCVQYLYAELVKVCGKHVNIFYDQVSMKPGQRVRTPLLQYARTCKLFVVFVSEEYFTVRRWPMMELAASHTASEAGNRFGSVPSLYPVFFGLHPNEAMNKRRGWLPRWEELERHEPRDVQFQVWKEAVERLLDTNGLIFREAENSPKEFLKKVAQDIAHTLDRLNGGLKKVAQDIAHTPDLLNGGLKKVAQDIALTLDRSNDQVMKSPKNFKFKKYLG